MTRGRDTIPKVAEPPAVASAAKARATLPSETDRPRRGELQDRIAEELRRALMRGQFYPGQKLPLRSLAEQLGTSLMPVRQVVSQLSAAGVLETLPNRSVQVPVMTESRFKELTQVRVLLEGMAAELACQHCPPALLKSLLKIDRELTKHSRERNVLGILRSNQAFHFGIYAAANSDILLPLIEALWLRSGPMMYFSLSEHAHIWDGGTHADILDAMRNGDSHVRIPKPAIFRHGAGRLSLERGATRPLRRRKVVRQIHLR